MDIELGEGNNEVKAGDIRMKEIAMGDQTKQSTEYLAGVVEGFYGAPWTEGQRKHLIKNMTEYHLNTYVYAPKDDRKHRADWRALYDPVECETLKSLIDCCKESGVIFIYTLSPGIDIVYSSKTERQLLVEKFQQMQNMGATGFGLLFDDIEAVMDTDDSLTYDHVASAQSEITNYVYGILGRPKYFLFCPTEYSTSRADPNLFDSKYLNILGQTLESDIMILWTGPRVISKMIPIDHIRNVTRIFNRPPVIWDNLHANDYDRRNVFMGPYKNRHLELCHLTKGIFLNPNCQYDLNYVPIRSFGMFVDAAFKCCPPKDSSKSLNSSSLSLDHGDYDPNRVFKDCCRLWAEDIKKSTSTLLPSDSNCESCLEGSNEHIHLGVALDESSKCTFKDKDKYPKQIDLYRVASFFYLPGEFGPLVNDIYRAFDILARNSINKWQKKVNDRFNAHTALENYKVSFKSLCDKVVSSTKTILRSHSLYIRPEILPFVMEIRESIHLMRSYVKYLETNNVNDDSVSDPDTIVNRTRFYTEIQKIIPSFAFNGIVHDNLADSDLYVIRPPHDYDLERLETICYGHLINKFGYWDDLRPSKRLSNLRYLDTFLRTNYEMYVVEDSSNLCGYMIYKLKSDLALEEQLQSEYNSHVVNNSLTDHYYTNFIKYPEIVSSILQEYPVRVQFCFQVGFKKARIFLKLLEFLKRKLVQNNLAGAHIIVDKFELVETSLLKSSGFYVPTDGSLPTHKYYVLNKKT